MTKISILLLTVFLIISCGPQPEPPTNTAEVRQAIEAANAQLVEAFNQGDAAAAAAFYTEDAIFMPPNSEPARGRQAIQEKTAADMAALHLSDLALTTSEVDVHGDTAIETGSFTIKLTPPGQEEAIQDQGKYIVIWKKQADGSWKVHRDIFNSNISPPAPETSEGTGQ